MGVLHTRRERRVLFPDDGRRRKLAEDFGQHFPRDCAGTQNGRAFSGAVHDR